MTDMMQFTPEEEAQFGNLSEHDLMDPVEKQIVEHLAAISQTMVQQIQILQQLQQSIAELAHAINRPKRVIYDATGRAAGIEATS